MADTPFNKFRAATEVLMRGRDVLVEALADDILENPESLSEGGFTFNEFLETQGTRLHFLCLLLAQLEQSADSQDERHAEIEMQANPPAKPKRRTRAKKVTQQNPSEGSPDDS